MSIQEIAQHEIEMMMTQDEFNDLEKKWKSYSAEAELAAAAASFIDDSTWMDNECTIEELEAVNTVDGSDISPI